MNSKKKFKNLLNSVSGGTELNGALQKIQEIFLEDLQKEVDKLKPDLTQAEDKINQLMSNFETIISDKENKISKIQKSLENISLNTMDEKLQDVKDFLDKIDNKIKNLGNASDEVSARLNKGRDTIEGIFKKGHNEINNQSQIFFRGLTKDRDNVLNTIRTEIEERKSYLEEFVETWKQSIKDRTDSFEKEFGLYIEQRGIELIIKYVQNNAFRLLWTLFVGIFKKYKEKKSK